MEEQDVYAEDPPIEDLPQEEPELPEVNPEIEDQARRYGWKPKDEWVGDTTNWRDAESFMQQGHIVAKKLEERLGETERQAQERIARLEQEAQDRFARLDAMNKQAAEIRKQNHARELQRIKAEMKSAVENGDMERFNALMEAQDATYAAQEQEREAPAPQQPKNDEPPAGDRAAFHEWANANPWFNTDPEMNGAANGYFASIQNNGKPIRENLQAVTQRMRELYPAKFGMEPQRHAKVDSGGLAGAGRKRGKGVAELPAEAKEAGRNFVEEGLFENMEAYAKSYWEMEA